MAYSLCPDLNISRLIVTSAYSIGRAPSLLSMVSVTSARPSGGREVVPAKTTSSILPPRSDLAPCSPITQESASTMLDLPEPFGPTTQVMPCSRRSEVAEANDLKPRRVRDFRYTCPLLPRICPVERPPPEHYRQLWLAAGNHAERRRNGKFPWATSDPSTIIRVNGARRAPAANARSVSLATARKGSESGDPGTTKRDAGEGVPGSFCGCAVSRPRLV